LGLSKVNMAQRRGLVCHERAISLFCQCVVSVLRALITFRVDISSVVCYVKEMYIVNMFWKIRLN
jgi:hypothetical protein